MCYSLAHCMIVALASLNQLLTLNRTSSISYTIGANTYYQLHAMVIN